MASLKLKWKLILISFVLLLGVCSYVENIKIEKKMKLIYVYDPLCGWCYGFGPVVEELEKNYSDRVSIDIIPGGMVMGSRIRPVGEMADYILGAIPRLEKMTGVKMGEPYKALLREGTYITSSLKPSIALLVFKSFKKEGAIAYAHDVQEAFFLHAKDLNQDELYAEIAKNYDLPEDEFLKRLKNPEYEKLTKKEFQQVSKMGVNGFPALLIEKDDSLYMLNSGFVEYKKLASFLDKQLEK